MALTDNIVSYWKFDENSGTVANDSVTTNNGNITGNGTYWTPGIINSGGSFNGNNNIVTIADNASVDFTGSVSISAWANMSTFNVNNQIMSKRAVYNGTGIPYELTIMGPTIGTLSFRVVGNTLTNGTHVIGPGTTYHFVSTWDGTTAIVYINGTQSNTGAISGPIQANGSPVIIGNFPGGNEDFQGWIDEVGLWKRALSSAEVGTLYNAGAGLQYPFSSGAAMVIRGYRTLLGIGN